MKLSKWIDKGLDSFDLVLQILGILLLGSVAISVTLQVFSRYITQSSIPWTAELASYSFVWLSMIAIALGIRRGRHMVLDVWEYLPDRRWLAITIETVAAAVVAAVLILLAWYGSQGLGAAFNRTLPGLGIAYGWVTLAVPVGSVVALIFAIEAWWKRIHAKQGEDPLTAKVLFQPKDSIIIKGEI